MKEQHLHPLIFLILTCADIATTYIGLTYKDLVESNPIADSIISSSGMALFATGALLVCVLLELVVNFGYRKIFKNINIYRFIYMPLNIFRLYVVISNIMLLSGVGYGLP
jgi:hypothetical protein